MRTPWIAAMGVLAVSLHAQAAPERTPLKQQAKAGAAQIDERQAWAFEEYLELHREAGYARYAPPFETVLTKAPGSCPKTRVLNVN